MALFDLKAMAEKEVAKVVNEINDIPGVETAESNIKSGIATIESALSKVTPDEVTLALNTLFPGKFTAAEVAAVFADGAKMVEGFAVLQAAIHSKIAPASK